MNDKKYNTMTGSVEPTSEAGLTLKALMDAAEGFQLSDGAKRLYNGDLKNTGAVVLSVAAVQDDFTGNPTTAQYVTIPVGEFFIFERIHIDKTWIRTVDDAGSNALAITGTPANI